LGLAREIVVPTLVASPAQSLLERETELETLIRACRDTATGSMIVLRGPAGIGKTALIDRATVDCAASGRWVLAGSGAELERDLAFGVARQLLEPALRRCSDEQRASLFQGAAALAMPVLDPDPAAKRPAPMHASLHGLYWLAAELAAIQPLLLTVDDLHWADVPSLRWLAYLGRRLTGVPVLLVTALRDAEPGADTVMLDRVLADSHARVLGLESLSEPGVGRWLTGVYGQMPPPAFVRGCRNVTGGNPFLLQEVTASLQAEGRAPDDEAASHLDGIAPASIGQSVLTRLAPLGTDAVTVAEAAAVLSTDARLERVAAIAHVSLDRVAEIADRLTAAGISGVASRSCSGTRCSARPSTSRRRPRGVRSRISPPPSCCSAMPKGPNEPVPTCCWHPSAAEPGSSTLCRPPAPRRSPAALRTLPYPCCGARCTSAPRAPSTCCWSSRPPRQRSRTRRARSTPPWHTAWRRRRRSAAGRRWRRPGR
jgi:AAA ATPase domain